MKKIASILMAVLMVFGALVITTSATDAPVVNVKADVASAKVGDVVTVTVAVAENSNLCTFMFDLNYDAECFEASEPKVYGTFNMEEYNDIGGTIKYAGFGTSYLTDAAKVMTVELKVLKVGGTVSLTVTEAFVKGATDLDDLDVTNDIVVNGANITIACSHANKTEEVVKEPTCTEAGSKAVKCADCGKELGTEAIKATGHKFGKDSVVKEPTCTEAGIAKGVCEKCGEEEESAIKATGHKWGKWVTVKDATVDAEGVAERKCSACGKTETRAIAKLPAAADDVVNPDIPQTDAQ